MQTEYDFTNKKKIGLKKDLEHQKEYAETKRQRLTEQEKEIEDKIREKKILDKQNV
jgi:predicted RNase H-like nuclease